MVPSQPYVPSHPSVPRFENDLDNRVPTINNELNVPRFASPLPQHQQHYRHSTTGKPKLGTYEIDKTIGKGIFSVVKLATHTITGINLAIKLIDKTRLDAENLIKIYRESEILKRLHHPNIVKLFQVMETPKLLCLVMEFLPNGEVFDYIATHGRFSENEARGKFLDVLCAVDYIHASGIVHRDLKAENLLFDSEMNIKLIDFSFGTSHSDSSFQSLLTTWCGSPPYAAPEIFKGEPYVGTKADIWSLGVVLYVMVCGTLPFDAQPLPHLKKQVLSASFRVPYWLSLSCERLIRAMLAKVPSKRPTTRELFLHPWLSEPSQQQVPGVSKVESSCCDGSPYSNTIGAVSNDDSVTTPLAEPVENRDIFLPNPLDISRRRSLVEPGSDLAADVEFGRVNEFVILIMESYGMKRAQILDSLNRRAYDHLMATYLLLGEKVRRHRHSLQLPVVPDRHLLACSVPTKTTAPSSSPPLATERLLAKQSRVDSAVDVKSVISESDSNASFFIPDTGAPCSAGNCNPWRNDPRNYATGSSVADRLSFNEQMIADVPPQVTSSSTWTMEFNQKQNSLPVPTYDETPLCSSFEDRIMASFEPNPTVNLNGEDKSTRPWLITGSYAFHDEPSASNEPPSLPRRHNLVRRKYGVFDPPAQLAQLAQSVLAEQQLNSEAKTVSETDSFSMDDGC